MVHYPALVGYDSSIVSLDSFNFNSKVQSIPSNMEEISLDMSFLITLENQRIIKKAEINSDNLYNEIKKQIEEFQDRINMSYQDCKVDIIKNRFTLWVIGDYGKLLIPILGGGVGGSVIAYPGGIVLF